MSEIKENVDKVAAADCDHVETDAKVVSSQINQKNVEMYQEAIERYPNDETIDAEDERRVLRKLDKRIIPVLGICYFFYVSTDSRTTWRGYRR